MSEQDNTPEATPETPVAPPAPDTVAEPDVETQVEQKTFTQAELDAIVQKEKAKAESKSERRALKAYRETLERIVPQQQNFQPQPPGKPSREHFASDESYIEAITDWKINMRDSDAKHHQLQQQHKSLVEKTEAMYAEAAKDKSFDREEFESLPLTPSIARVVTESDEPAKLMVYMQANPAEIERISKLSPTKQASEMGKLELMLAKEPKTSRTPAPINPVGGGKTSVASLATASHEEYRKLREKQGARWAR